jgi:hypothetical protein
MEEERESSSRDEILRPAMLGETGKGAMAENESKFALLRTDSTPPGGVSKVEGDASGGALNEGSPLGVQAGRGQQWSSLFRSSKRKAADKVM